MREKEDYIPYGDEWKREMNKLPKDVIIDVASKIGIERDLIRDQRNEMLELLREVSMVQDKYYGRGSETHMALNKLVKTKINPLIEEIK